MQTFESIRYKSNHISVVMGLLKCAFALHQKELPKLIAEITMFHGHAQLDPHRTYLRQYFVWVEWVGLTRSLKTEFGFRWI
jgi:hypothetical protein